MVTCCGSGAADTRTWHTRHQNVAHRDARDTQPLCLSQGGRGLLIERPRQRLSVYTPMLGKPHVDHKYASGHTHTCTYTDHTHSPRGVDFSWPHPLWHSTF